MSSCAAASDMLHNSSWHSEITALCPLWLCAVAELHERNNSMDYSKIGIRVSTKIGAFSTSTPVTILKSEL